MDKLNRTLYLPSSQNSTDTQQKLFEKSTRYYNRFKTLNPNNILQKG